MAVGGRRWWARAAAALALLSLLSASSSAATSPATPRLLWPYGPHSDFLSPAVVRCSDSFDDLSARKLARPLGSPPDPAWLGLANSHPLTALCPPNCTLPSPSSSPPYAPSTSLPAVYGSSPYHGRSSVCLAAVHAGLIDASTGGGVFISPFYRHDWSGGDAQTIFPFQSNRGRLSNGVRSLDVPAHWHSVPSNASAYSYTVRNRGDSVVQRRQAPWPVRSNHLQVLWPKVTIGTEVDTTVLINATISFWHMLIAGGYNGSHYLNDVTYTPPHPAPTHLALCHADPVISRSSHFPAALRALRRCGWARWTPRPRRPVIGSGAACPTHLGLRVPM